MSQISLPKTMKVFSIDGSEYDFDVVFITYYTFDVDMKDCFVGLHLELFCRIK